LFGFNYPLLDKKRKSTKKEKMEIDEKVLKLEKDLFEKDNMIKVCTNTFSIKLVHKYPYNFI